MIEPAALLAEAAALARKGEGEVEPNPQVGALVVRGDAIVGRGYHACYGGPHAEVEALADAGPSARGATLVVTLEPCSTTGKTPPCVGAIAAAGIARVIVGCIDPNPAHAGRGVALLRERGIAVDGPFPTAGLDALLERFRRALASPRPWVIAKWAMSLDGRIATRAGDSRWITGDAARERVHRWRGRVDAIAVGGGTARADRPRLTARPQGPRSPLRVVFSRSLDLPSDWPAPEAGAPAVVAIHAASAPESRKAAIESRGVERIEIDDGAAVTDALAKLRGRSVYRLLVEGGGALAGELFDAGAVDYALAFLAPVVIGGDAAKFPVGGRGVARLAEALRLEGARYERLGDDVLVEGFVPPRLQ